MLAVVPPPLRRLLWRGRAVLALLVVVVLAGCRADASVRVDVEEDGGGLVSVTVALDVAAAARTVWSEGALPLDDLVEAGWTVTGPVRQPDGGAVFTATKPFSQPDQLPGVLAEVAGPQ